MEVRYNSADPTMVSGAKIGPLKAAWHGGPLHKVTKYQNLFWVLSHWIMFF